MVQLIYTSKAVQPFTTKELKLLLGRARMRNLYLDITGMLLYDCGAFLQVLEGPAVNVDEVYSSIVRDSRHTSVRLIERITVETREFNCGSMGFVNFANSQRRPDGTAEGLDLSPDAEPSAARRYLRLFQEDLYRELVRKSGNQSARLEPAESPG